MALIPLLNDESAVLNDVILAITVLLRLSEELECTTQMNAESDKS